MPQKTNLNISPYFDDFSKDNQFYRVLFNPGKPVQARELTTLQSILQDQVESFGSHIFKEGSMVIPGNTNYDYEYYSIKLNSDHLGIPVSLYIENLKGKTLVGQNTGIRIKLDNYALPSDANDITDLTIFVKYLDSGTDKNVSFMEDGENLLIEETITYGNTQIASGETVATLIDSDASRVGSAVSIADGVFFIRGHFVNVTSDKIVLDPYTNTPNYRVGLFIQEEIITAKDDSSLYDNARGFSNFAAPGADRLKISTKLIKKPLTDFNDKNFVELVRLDNGQLKRTTPKAEYSLIKDYFAKRTYEESGNYSVGNYSVEVNECLNDGLSNEGVYKAGETTDMRNIPVEELMCVKVSPGKAYVRGYDVEKSGTSVIDVDKPRDKENLENSAVNFALGTLFKLNNLRGAPKLGLNQDTTIQLLNQRSGSGNSTAQGSQIGSARAYALENANGKHTDASTVYDLYVFDVQMFTNLILNLAVSNTELPATSFVEGLTSGASGFAAFQGGGSATIKLRNVSGTFIAGEQIRINGRLDLVRNISGDDGSTKAVLKHGTQDVLSVFSSNPFGTGAHFNGDLLLEAIPIKGLGIGDEVNVDGSNVLKCAGITFGSLKINDHIIVNLTSDAAPRINRVSAITDNLQNVTLAASTTVTGVSVGTVLASATPTGIHIARPKILKVSKGLFAELAKRNVSDVSLESSSILVKKQIQKTPSSGSVTVSLSDVGITSAFFVPFDGERYSVNLNTNGTYQELDRSQVVLGNNNSTVTINGLSNTASTITLTVQKNVISPKSKVLSRANSITISKASPVGIATHGLTHSPSYGLRIDDKEISLNTTDVTKVLKVFESTTGVAPTPDKLIFVSGLSLNTATILGEKIIGSTSGAIAALVGQVNATTVEIVNLTRNKFIIGESITFEESSITTNLQGITLGQFKDITSNYILDKGQRDEYYDYSRLVRKDGAQVPSRILKVFYNKFTVPSDDTGDVYTVSSYPVESFKDVPLFSNGLRASDALDFRPRVKDFTGSTSPFDFASRDFSQSGTGNPTLIPAPNESSVVDFSFYLPRIDKLVLDIADSRGPDYLRGEFQILKGVSSQEPLVPLDVETAMTIGTIELPPYLYNPKDAVIKLLDNRRYTMRDIGGLEDRIENLEIATSLSLLELDTKSLQIQDADGLSRFKTGFFVDDFQDASLLDRSDPDCKCDIIASQKHLVTPTDFYSVKPELALNPSLNSNTADFSDDLALLDSGIRKTGDLITLDYDERQWITQPLASRVENVNPFNIVTFRGRMTLNPSADTWTRNVIIDGGTRTVLGDVQGTWTSDQIISSEPDTHIRSRNVQFDVSGMKPTTRLYPFFDSTSGIDVIPKLIEISMSSGAFSINEIVEGFDGADRIFVARTCAPNHKTGSIAAPTTTFTTDPYNTSLTVPSVYSSASTILNIDVASLVEEAQGRFFGFITSGLTLVGQESGATATVSNIRLVTDILGDLNGSFFFRDPLTVPSPPLMFTNGTKTFKLTSSETNGRPLLGDPSITEVETPYRTSGVVDTFRQSSVVVRIPPPPPEPVVFNITNVTEEITQNVTNVTEVTDVTNVTNVTEVTNVTNVTEVTNVIRETVVIEYDDPLAQSFTVDESGAFLTSVDLFFRSKDEREKLTVQIRTVELGIPTLILLQDYAQVVLEPSQINISEDASVATNIKFPSPIYLEGGQDYAVVLLAPSSDNYEAWVGRMGEPTIGTQTLPDAESIIISKQYIGGSLFKSQNGSIWTASQFEDLKFTLYKADFAKSRDATLFFYNPELNYESAQVSNLLPNALRTLPRKLKVKIDSHVPASGQLNIGEIIGEGTATAAGITTSPRGRIERVGGKVGTLSVSSKGSGYPSALSGTTANTFAITGNGTGLVITINTSSAPGDKVTAVAGISNRGSGYSVGDVVGIVTSSSGIGSGTGAQLTIGSLQSNQVDTLYLTDVQGENFGNNAQLLRFVPGNKTFTNVQDGSSTNILVDGDSTVIDDLHTGNVLEVSQYNHGMHSGVDKLQISNVEPDTQVMVLDADLDIGDTQLLVSDPAASGVAATSEFSRFEGITTSKGYLKVNNEIIFYDGIQNDDKTLDISVRGIDGSAIREHAKGSIVQKYELNGLSLTGINSEHQFSTRPTLLVTESDIDKYYIQIDRGANRGGTGVGAHLPNRSQGDTMANFTDNRIGGGDEIFASQNIQYNQIYPRFNFITPGQTALSAKVRSVSGRSAGGNEVAFLDQGFEDVKMNSINSLKSPRIVASPVNETAYLNSLPKNRSSTLAVRMLSGDRNLSPILDTMNGSILYIRNRLNKPISDYASDQRVKLNTNDPHAGIYISNRIDLKQPATSLQVFVTANRPESADFRVLYKLFSDEVSAGEQSYELFPGFDNLLDTDGDGFGDEVIDLSRNSGRPDALVPSSTGGEFLEYQFSADNLQEFTGFVIKVVFSGTNEAEAPRLKDIRAIALA